MLAVLLPKLPRKEIYESIMESRGRLTGVINIEKATDGSTQLSRTTSNASTVQGRLLNSKEKDMLTTNTTHTAVSFCHPETYPQSEASKTTYGALNTGFGSSPTSRSDLIWNGVAIIFPAVLFTVETGIRTAQAHYAPIIGTLPPWVRPPSPFVSNLFKCYKLIDLLHSIVYG
jgi:hypothetical protein